MRSWKYSAEAINGQRVNGSVSLAGLRIARRAVKTALNLTKEHKIAVRPFDTLLIEYGIQTLLRDTDLVSIEVESHERRGKYG